MSDSDSREDQWSEEDVEEFRERVESGDVSPNEMIRRFGRNDVNGSSSEQPEVNVGSMMVGIVLTFLIGFALFSGAWVYVMYCSALLVVLALGSKALN